MTRKISFISFVLLCAMVVQVFASGQSQTGAVKGKTRLTVATNWVGEDAKAAPLAKIVADFNAANPDIEVVIENYGGTEVKGAREAMEAALISKKAPEVIFENTEGVTKEWFKAGYILDVEPLAKKIGVEKFMDAAITEATRHSSKGWIGLPIEGFVWPLWYNSEILAKAGVPVPKTWQDLIAAAPKIKSAGYEVWAIGGSDWDFQKVPYLAIAGALGVDKYHKAVIAAQEPFARDPKTRMALETLESAIKSGVFQKDFAGYDWQSSGQLFYQGKAAFRWDGNWSWADIPADLRQKVKLTGFPTMSGGIAKPLGITGYAAKLFMITKNGAEKIDAVERFAQFLFKTESMDRFVKSAAMISPLKETKLSNTEIDPLIKEASVLFASGVTVVDLPDNAPPAIYEELNKIATDFAAGVLNASSFIDKLEKAYARR